MIVPLLGLVLYVPSHSALDAGQEYKLVLIRFAVNAQVIFPLLVSYALYIKKSTPFNFVVYILGPGQLIRSPGGPPSVP